MRGEDKMTPEEKQLEDVMKLMEKYKPKKRNLFAEILGTILGLTFPVMLLSGFIYIIVFTWRYILGL